MGLRVEVRPSFGEQSQDLSPNRLPGGYPGLTPSLPTLSRRKLITAVFGGAVTLAADQQLSKIALAQVVTSNPDAPLLDPQIELVESLPVLEQLLAGQSPTVELSIDGTDGETHLIQAFNTADCEVFIKGAEPTIPISLSFQNRPNPIPDAVRDAFTQAFKAGGFKDSRIVLTPNLIPSEAQPYSVIVDMPKLDRTSYQIQRKINTRLDGVPSLDVIFVLPQSIIDKLKIDRLFKDVFMQSLAFQYGAIVASGGNPQAMPDILTAEQQKTAGTITRFVKDFLSVETIAQEGSDEIPQSTELFHTTPKGKLTTENFPPDLPQGQVRLKLRAESAAKTDEFFDELGVQVKFRPNPQLRSGIGTYDLKPCKTCTRTPERWGILKGVVEPEDPRTLIMEFNIFRSDYKLDPAWREQMADSNAGTIGLELSKVIYRKSLLEGLTQKEANRIGDIAHKLQYEIRPLEWATPTTG